MKKYLSLLAATTLGVSASANLLIGSNLLNKQNLAFEWWYEPDSVGNLIRDIDNIVAKDNPRWVHGPDEDIPGNTQDTYDKFINHKEANLGVLKSVPKDESIIKTFKNYYKNNTSSEQTFYTQEYSETLSNTYSFSSSLTESAGLSVGVSFSFINSQINVSLSSNQEWTNTETRSQTLTAPSQPFKVPGHKTGIATYVIKKGTYDNSGALRVSVNLDDTISSSLYWNQAGQWDATRFTMREIIKILADNGFRDRLLYDSEIFSVITTDNIDNPTSVSLNLPIKWTSEGGSLDVTFSESD